MLGALTALLNSEKAVAGGVLIIAATALTALGHMTIADWTTYTQWIFGIYVGGKTVQGGTSLIARAIEHKADAASAAATVIATASVTPTASTPKE